MRGSRWSCELQGLGDPPFRYSPPASTHTTTSSPSRASSRCSAGPQGQMAGEALCNPRLSRQVNAEAEIPFALTFNHNRSFYLRA